MEVVKTKWRGECGGVVVVKMDNKKVEVEVKESKEHE